MIEWIYIEFMVLVCVVALTGIIIPQILLIAFRRNLFDKPDPRKIHKADVPRLGGIAFVPAILFAVLLLLGIGILNGNDSILQQMNQNLLPLCLVGCATIILYLTGMADDMVGVRYRAKFVMQSLSAGLVILSGIRIENLHGFLGITALPLGAP